MNESKSILESAMSGIRSVVSSFDFIARNGMRKVYLWIFGVMLVLFFCGVRIAGPVKDYTYSLVESQLTSINAWSWLTTVLSSMSGILSWLLAMALVFILSGYVALILLSPVFSYMSEKTIRIMSGRKNESSFKVLLKGIVRGVSISVRNMLMQLVITILLFFGSFIPVVGVVCPFMIFVVDAFFVGFSMVDYSLEVTGLNVGESIRYGRGNRGFMFGIGFLYSLATKLPLVGIYIAILIAPACVVGAARQIGDSVSEGEITRG